MDRDEQLLYEKLVKLVKTSDAKLSARSKEEIRKIRQRQTRQQTNTNRTQYFR